MGVKKHLDALDEVLAEDPILERDIRFAKKSIITPSKKSKSAQEKEIDELTKKLDSIRKLVE